MKHLLLTTIATVVLVWCGPSAPGISIDRAAHDGNIEAVKQHLAAGTDVNALSVLHHAAFSGRKEIVELLIANGADVNAKMFDGKTPLDFTVVGVQPETTALLRKYGGKTGEEL